MKGMESAKEESENFDKKDGEADVVMEDKGKKEVEAAEEDEHGKVVELPPTIKPDSEFEKFCSANDDNQDKLENTEAEMKDKRKKEMGVAEEDECMKGVGLPTGEKLKPQFEKVHSVKSVNKTSKEYKYRGKTSIWREVKSQNKPEEVAVEGIDMAEGGSVNQAEHVVNGESKDVHDNEVEANNYATNWMTSCYMVASLRQ